ncbi:MAG: hypothetical protein A2942_01445 [Candidatus Lloydbacteria bacterium RIFCSPLOWO2_01_FULL_50_20]|uniref:Metal-dependent hydrolase n=1 Tax=Candidatus Lloydbacteria bacterium RIFCSPLOWO2_01_FULL_50_20 TaxID=1798665 RepID=A0A1G2DJJ0_9BACT|nr:MAG: hypothetical protein A3C13_00550 [Candidatus Lloydbacteria bacterium RIFCSPHIGHO2_02_FULL_50_11]OGZ13101.1 MAG: hypothetical protein A2942_01445 [Candidatus Lloydbacteria bacterium RIFCSPLOWO2_01_FULL_50_20]
MWFWTLASLGLAGFLDLVAGVFFVHLLSLYFGHPLLWWQYAIGAALGASPDIDLLYAFFKKNLGGHHEYLTHRPIIGIPLAIIIGWFLGGAFWATAALIGVFWHYLHDTEGFLCLYDNGGLAWFWPFSKEYWGVRDFRVVSRMPEVHTRKEEDVFDNVYKVYLIPTRQAITEFLLTGIFFGYVIGDTLGVHISVAATYVFWVGVAALWIVYHCRSTQR